MSTHLSPLDLMERLVSFPTVSRDTNIPLIDWVADYLAGHGIESHRHLHPSEPKQGLFAHVGPWEEGAVVLSGHTDVVPVDGQDWTTDPFTVVERDGRFYGRGTCDMKGFDALAIWALVEAHRVGVARPLQIALSYDEEVGCIGAAPLIEAMQPVVPKGSAVIVGEPSMMETVSGHKGSVAFRTHVQGFEVHSSLIDRGVSAIMHGAKLIDWCNDQNAASAAATPSETALLYDPPFSTAHVGTIRGGTAENITAKDCHFSVIVRFVPDETRAEWERRYMAKVAEVRAAMQAVRPETGIAVTISSEVPALRAEQQGEAEALVRSLTGDNGVHGVSYGTEAGHFQNAGYSAIVCGPGNIAQAHQPDEYILRAQLDAGHDFMRRLIERLRS